jgi:hypothetical protein
MPVSLFNDSLMVELPGVVQGPRLPLLQAAACEKNADNICNTNVPITPSQEKLLGLVRVIDG